MTLRVGDHNVGGGARRFARPSTMQQGEVVGEPLCDAVAEQKVLADKFLDKYESFLMPIGGW